LGIRLLKFKRYAVFDQTFSKKVCVFNQTFSKKVCDHAAARVFDQTFFEKVCGQAFFEKGCDHAVTSASENNFPIEINNNLTFLEFYQQTYIYYTILFYLTN
jgi:hypothetical protein